MSAYRLRCLRVSEIVSPIHGCPRCANTMRNRGNSSASGWSRTGFASSMDMFEQNVVA